MAEKQKGITIKKADDLPEWYGQICLKAELADFAPVKGFMIVRPRAYQIWEAIQQQFDSQIKKRGVKNAYFPLLIPEDFFKREAQHAEGFAPELAWIEKLDEQEERVAIRPTSETIMYDSYKNWIRSWRDLPLRINQWCNVLRWEVKQTKMFLRTREFLWQEGHCVYKTQEDMENETLLFLEEYKSLIEDYLAIPTIKGLKTKLETFAGADRTWTLEGLMPDGKALQMATSHDLGQNFAKVFGINFIGEDEKEHFGWQNSWGISTRLIGAIVMVHGDDNGLVIPPRIATEKVVIVPIYKDDTKDLVLSEASKVKGMLKDYNPIFDDREGYSPGWKFNEWEMKGIPIRIEMGPKDIENKQVVVVRRDTREKEFVPVSELAQKLPEILEKMQASMFEKAKKHLDSNVIDASTMDELAKGIEEKKLVKVDLDSLGETEDSIREKVPGVTSRCIVDGKTIFGKNY